MNTLDISEIETYLHDHIPLSRAMQVKVSEISNDAVRLAAPLAPNINHRETVFGGSASALAILAAWSTVHFRLRQQGLQCRVVIHKNSMSYDKPILGTFEAQSEPVEPDKWRRFITMVQKKGRGRIYISSKLLYDGEVVGNFEGSFVAILT